LLYFTTPACSLPDGRQAGGGRQDCGVSFRAITDFGGSETQIEIPPNPKLKIHYLPCADLDKNFIGLKNPAVTVQ